MNTIPQVDQYIANLDDWRGQRIAWLRHLIHQECPDITEVWKWDVPVYQHHKMVCATSAFKDHVKLNFFHGAKVDDPHHLFNSGLDSKLHRSINISQTDTIDEVSIRQLIRSAINIDKAG